MGGRILIIVSYNGDRHPTGYNPFQFLRIQHQQLTALKHGLDKVLIVVNDSGVYDKDYEEALSLFPNVLRRSNALWSYGGWKDGFLHEPDYEWYFFFEDDYTFFMDDFDQKWIDLWKPGHSYIAMKVGSDFGYPIHASIANGLTRGEILREAKWESLVGASEYDAKLQLSWSELFATEGLADIRGTYAAPFYSHNVLVSHGDSTLPLLAGPIQLARPDPITREVMLDRHKQRRETDFDYKVKTDET